MTSHRTPAPRTDDSAGLLGLLHAPGRTTDEATLPFPLPPAGNDESRMLPELVAHAMRAADADHACLILPAGDGRLRVPVAIGPGAEEFRELVFHPTESLLGRAILTGEATRTHDVALWVKPDLGNRHRFGPAMIIPIVAQGDRGAVLMMRVRGQVPFSSRDVDLASPLAAQVALAMELNDARVDAEHLQALEERHRIAQDLHDNVIQRLFATGVGLQALLGQLTDENLAERLRRHIADLDETLDQVRTTVYGLRDGLEPASLQETGVPCTAPRRDVMF